MRSPTDVKGKFPAVYATVETAIRQILNERGLSIPVVNRPGNIAANGWSALRCPLPAQENVTYRLLTRFAVPWGMVSNTLAYLGDQ